MNTNGRTLPTLLIFIFATCAALPSFGQATSPLSREAKPPADTSPAAPTLFGSLQTQDAHAADEYAGGERLAMMELSWRRYEPREGVFDAAYIEDQRRRLQKLRDAGFLVTLGLGSHYAPAWLAEKCDSRFVNQDGARSKDVNFVFNQKMRRYLERYLARIDSDLGLKNFWAIRLTSGGNGEVLYPGGGTFWAFDANAQNGPDMPAGMPRCPYPGWKPGEEGQTTNQVRQWADWYVDCLALTVDWQMRALDKLGFTGWRQVLTPGSGIRPSRYETAVGNRLDDKLFAVGAVWYKLYDFLPEKRRTVVYISSVADKSGENDASLPSDRAVSLTDPAADRWSATRWLVRIAKEYDMPVGGENPGFSLPASLNSFYRIAARDGMMARAFAQAKAGGFQCFYWAHSERLWDGTVSFQQYASSIAAATNSP